jgi:hypothetical protein
MKIHPPDLIETGIAPGIVGDARAWGEKSGVILAMAQKSFRCFPASKL